MTFKEQCALSVLTGLVEIYGRRADEFSLADLTVTAWKTADLMDAERCARTKDKCEWCAGNARMQTLHPGVHSPPCPDHS